MSLDTIRRATAALTPPTPPPATALPPAAPAPEMLATVSTAPGTPDPAGAADWCFAQHTERHGPAPEPGTGHNDWLAAAVKFCNERGAPEAAALALALSTAPAGHNAAKITATVRGIYRRDVTAHGRDPYTAPRAGARTGREIPHAEGLANAPGAPSLADSPLIPATVYAALPAFLCDCLSPFTGRERDVLLTALLATLSGCFPTVTGAYGHDTVGLNLYALTLAPAANGKGVLKWAGRLLNEWDRKLRRESAEARAAYDAELAEYTAHKKGGRNAPPVVGAPPVAPPEKRVLISANSSAAAFFNALADNGGFGVVCETEAATLAKILDNKEWGDFTPLLLAAFHHERYSSLRKTGELVLDRPALSVALTGTPGVLAQLMPDTENGLFSRFLFYTFAAVPEWKNPFARAEPLEPYYDALALRLLAMIEAVGGPVTVRLTETQQAAHAAIFTAWTADTAEADGQGHSSLRRLGLAALRLAMLLTVLRCFETGEAPAGVLTCGDEDFTAALVQRPVDA